MEFGNNQRVSASESPVLSEKKSRRRPLWWVLGTVLAVFAMVVFWIIADDDSPPLDAEMEVHWTEQAHDNPLAKFCVLIVGVAPVPPPSSLTKPGEDSQIEIYEEDVATWPSVLILMEELAASDPATWQWPNAELMQTVIGDPYYSEVIQNHAYVLEAKAKLLQHNGKPREAVDASLQLVHIGQGMLSTQGDLAHQRLGMDLASRGLRILEAVLVHPTTSPELLKHCLSELDRFAGPSRESLGFAIKLEYQRLKHQLDDKNWLAATGKADSEDLGDKLKAMLVFKPNRTLANILAIDRNILQLLSKDHLDGYLQSVIEQSQLQMSLKQQGMVRVILGANWSGLETTYDSVSEIRTHIRWAMAHDNKLRQVRLVLALRLYELEKGALPVTLEELMPAYLPAVPLDSFSKQPMRWNATTSIVYSIGPNLKDDHGHIQTTGPALHKDDSMLYWWRKPAKKSKASTP